MVLRQSSTEPRTRFWCTGWNPVGEQRCHSIVTEWCCVFWFGPSSFSCKTDEGRSAAVVVSLRCILSGSAACNKKAYCRGKTIRGDTVDVADNDKDDEFLVSSLFPSVSSSASSVSASSRGASSPIPRSVSPHSMSWASPSSSFLSVADRWMMLFFRFRFFRATTAPRTKKEVLVEGAKRTLRTGCSCCCSWSGRVGSLIADVVVVVTVTVRCFDGRSIDRRMQASLFSVLKDDDSRRASESASLGALFDFFFCSWRRCRCTSLMWGGFGPLRDFSVLLVLVLVP